MAIHRSAIRGYAKRMLYKGRAIAFWYSGTRELLVSYLAIKYNPGCERKRVV